MSAMKTGEMKGAVPEVDAIPSLPSLPDQAERLIATGVLDDEDVELTAEELRATASDLAARTASGALLVVSDEVLPVRTVVPHVTRTERQQQREGFVVVDMVDLEEFLPTEAAVRPEARIYAVEGPCRGDEMGNWSPAEAQQAFDEQGWTPFTVTEGVQWALQLPEVLDRNLCYMMIGSRKRRAKGFDARTPALWISNGTGRDGAERRGAPKLGWCWWNNRHTWLGFASGSRRVS